MTNLIIAAYLPEPKVFGLMGIHLILENFAAQPESVSDCFASKGPKMTDSFDGET